MNLKELLKPKLTKEEFKHLRRSFDQIGTIAQLEIPEELEHKERMIAQEVLHHYKNINTVVKKAGVTQGEHRIRPVKVLAGEDTTETIHKENGINMKLDLNKVFFTPRLSNERLRILEQVKKDEIVADLFCGVGPYSILIAKHSPCKKVIMNDINPDAVKYLKENLEMNKIPEEKYEVHNKDAKKFNLKTHRVIMNIPEFSEDFIQTGFKNTRKNGIIHYYTFGTIKELEEIKEKIKEHAPCRIINTAQCGDIGVRIYRWCLDIKVL